MDKPRIQQQDIRTLKKFYDLMDRTRSLRFDVVSDIFGEREADGGAVASLKNALASLNAVPAKGDKQVLLLDASKTIDVDLAYEIAELEKDIFFLENGEEEFIRYLESIHSGFHEHVDRGVRTLRGIRFNCFVTDRDGTINNYCGRYRSSVQSVYNAVFLTRFAVRRTTHPIIVTSAPLKGPGLMDVCVCPENKLVYAASKGREFVDLSGDRRTYPVREEKRELLARLNDRLCRLVEVPAFEKYSLIGSGLQLKFGQTTIARQDISRSIPEEESEAFLRRIRDVIADLDPEGVQFRIEDTGLDIEIILTIEDAEGGLKDFDKADAVKYLDRELNLELERGPHLVCGDTSSDVVMIEAVMERTSDTWSVFVTRDKTLADRVRGVCPRAVIVPEPDMLVTILGRLAGR